MEDQPQVRVCRQSEGAGLVWQVWYGERVVGRFLLLGEALDFAAILECSPRARNHVLQEASR